MTYTDITDYIAGGDALTLATISVAAIAALLIMWLVLRLIIHSAAKIARRLGHATRNTTPGEAVRQRLQILSGMGALAATLFSFTAFKAKLASVGLDQWYHALAGFTLAEMGLLIFGLWRWWAVRHSPDAAGKYRVYALAITAVMTKVCWDYEHLLAIAPIMAYVFYECILRAEAKANTIDIQGTLTGWKTALRRHFDVKNITTNKLVNVICELRELDPSEKRAVKLKRKRNKHQSRLYASTEHTADEILADIQTKLASRYAADDIDYDVDRILSIHRDLATPAETELSATVARLETALEQSHDDVLVASVEVQELRDRVAELEEATNTTTDSQIATTERTDDVTQGKNIATISPTTLTPPTESPINQEKPLAKTSTVSLSMDLNQFSHIPRNIAIEILDSIHAGQPLSAWAINTRAGKTKNSGTGGRWRSTLIDAYYAVYPPMPPHLATPELNGYHLATTSTGDTK